MTTVPVYSCSYLVSLSAVGFVRTTVQVFVGRASFERMFRRSERMDELVHMLSLVLGYWESLVVGPVYNRDCQGFKQVHLLF